MFISRAARAFCIAAVVTASWPVGAGQWQRRPPSQVPLTASGEPDWNAPTPRAADGKPDLSGMWRAGGGTRGGPSAFSYPGPTVWTPLGMWVGVGLPMTDYGESVLKARMARDSRDNPRSHCLPMGFMQLHVLGGPARYLQTPRELLILYEVNGERREIFTDGRSLPANSPQPWWNGYSVGRWEDDILVVETTHFRDDGWLDMAGSPLTSEAKVTERFRRPAFGRMEIDITIDDPKAYLRPFTVRWNQSLLLDQEQIEFVCLENNKFPRS